MTSSAQDIAAQAGNGESVIGWKLEANQRNELLQQFPPRYSNPVADHVTLRSGAAEDAILPQEVFGEVVGRVDDGEGVEALVVRIGGTTERPDGGIYHISWSLGHGRQARESNDVLARQSYEERELPMPIQLLPARWPRRSA